MNRIKKALPILRIIGLIVGVALACVGQYYWAEHKLRPGLWFYIAAGVLCILSLEVRKKRPIVTETVKWTLPVWGETVLLILILALAAWVRLYRVLEIPPGHFVDETHQAYEGVRVLRGELKNPFGTGWYQVPTLYFYYVALVFKLFGISVFVMKCSTVFYAVLTILPLYFLSRQWFGKGIGLTLATFMATNRWHLTMSRWGMVEVFPPLFEMAMIYFLVRGMSNGKGFPFSVRFTKPPKPSGDEQKTALTAPRQERDKLCPGFFARIFFFALAGACLGLSQYTYLAARLLPPIGLGLILWVLLTRKKSITKYLIPSIIFIAAFAGVVAPLAKHFRQRPEEFRNRTNQVNILNDVKDRNSYEPLVQSIKRHASMFHYQGDNNGRHNFPGQRMLSHALGILFLLGAFVSLARLFHPWRAVLWGAFLCTMAGGFLSKLVEAPQAFRTLTVVPIVILFAGVFLDSAWSLLKEVVQFKVRWPRIALYVLGILVLLGCVGWSSYQDVDFYFRVQGLSPQVRIHYNMEATFVARRLTELSREDTIYMFEGFAANSICQFLNHDATNHYRFKRIKHLPLYPCEDGDIRILGPSYWSYLEDVLKVFYPNARMQKGMDPAINGLMYLEFVVPKSDWNALAGAKWEIRGASDSSVVLGSQVVSQMGVSPEFARQTIENLSERPTRYRFNALLFAEYLREFTFSAKREGPGDPVENISVRFDGLEKITQFDTPYLAKFLPGRVSVEMIIDNPQPGVGYFLCWDGEGGHNKPISRRPLCALEKIPYGLLGTYYMGGNKWDGEPIGTRQDLFIEAMQEFPYSVEWNGLLVAPKKGKYQFTAKADDHTTIWVNNEQILSINFDANASQMVAYTKLEKGPNPIKIRYYDNGGGQYLEIKWGLLGSDSVQLGWKDLLPPAAE